MEYSARLLKKGNFATRYSHRRRYSTLIHLLKNGPPHQRVLDWGCADGLMLKLLRDEEIIQKGIGIDINPEMVEQCRQSSKHYPGLCFFTLSELKNQTPLPTFDLLICTETLEHVKDFRTILSELKKFSHQDSTLIVSVPIEVGPSLMMKQSLRFFANLNKSYGYDKYRFGELIQAGIFWNVAQLSRQREKQKEEDPRHKGFDYRLLEDYLKREFTIVKTLCSPFPVFKTFLNSTIYWILKNK